MSLVVTATDNEGHEWLGILRRAQRRPSAPTVALPDDVKDYAKLITLERSNAADITRDRTDEAAAAAAERRRARSS